MKEAGGDDFVWLAVREQQRPTSLEWAMNGAWSISRY